MNKISIHSLIAKEETVETLHQLYEVNISGGYRAVCKIGSAKMYKPHFEEGYVSFRSEKDQLTEVLAEVLTGMSVLGYELLDEDTYLAHGKAKKIRVTTIQGSKREEFDMEGTIKYLGNYNMIPSNK